MVWVKTFYQAAVITILIVIFVVFLGLFGIDIFPKPILSFEAIFTLYGFMVFTVILANWSGSPAEKNKAQA